MRLMTREEIDRLPRRSGLCRECGEPIVGRPATASTCLIHREFPGPPTREELVALIEEHEATVALLRKALATIDEEEGDQ